MTALLFLLLASVTALIIYIVQCVEDIEKEDREMEDEWYGAEDDSKW